MDLHLARLTFKNDAYFVMDTIFIDKPTMFMLCSYS